jgi:hypothetical protein
VRAITDTMNQKAPNAEDPATDDNVLVAENDIATNASPAKTDRPPLIIIHCGAAGTNVAAMNEAGAASNLTAIDPNLREWLLDSDPAIRSQVLRDLLDAPEAEWRAERDRIETEGWGARLFELQDADGQWAGGGFMPSDFDWHGPEWEAVGQPWTATCWTLDTLREFGLDPESASARRTVALVGDNSRWDHDGEPFWDGEVEECINGRTVADGAWFGVDVSPIVEMLLGQQMDDGGWNCERENGSVRGSFHSTINVLEGLLLFESRFGSSPVAASGAARAARHRGEEFLLSRGLLHRLGTGEIIDDSFAELHHPSRYRFDVLRGLDYFRAASRQDGAVPDPRLSDAVDILRHKRRDDGRWNLDVRMPGRQWFEVDDGPGEPSRWVTLGALRVLRWWDGRQGLFAR